MLQPLGPNSSSSNTLRSQKCPLARGKIYPRLFRLHAPRSALIVDHCTFWKLERLSNALLRRRLCRRARGPHDSQLGVLGEAHKKHIQMLHTRLASIMPVSMCGGSAVAYL
jgi:hypothetical protein